MPKSGKKTPPRYQPYPSGSKDLRADFQASGRAGRRNAVTEVELSNVVWMISRRNSKQFVVDDELSALISSVVPEKGAVVVGDLPADLAKLKCTDESSTSSASSVPMLDSKSVDKLQVTSATTPLNKDSP